MRSVMRLSGFIFCFLFPHQTSERTEGSTFYEKYIREEYNDFQLLTYRRICQEVLQGRFRTVELWNSRQGKIYFLCRGGHRQKDRGGLFRHGMLY